MGGNWVPRRSIGECPIVNGGSSRSRWAYSVPCCIFCSNGPTNIFSKTDRVNSVTKIQSTHPLKPYPPWILARGESDGCGMIRYHSQWECSMLPCEDTDWAGVAGIAHAVRGASSQILSPIANASGSVVDMIALYSERGTARRALKSAMGYATIMALGRANDVAECDPLY
jgi:hypothetical protein